MQIKGTVSRAYVGPNGNVVHVVPTDRAIMRDIDGTHQTGAGEIKVFVATLAQVGDAFDATIDDDALGDGSRPLSVR